MIQITSIHHIYYIPMEREIFLKIPRYMHRPCGWDAFEVPTEDWIELPHGGSLYELPGRKGIGIDVKHGDMRFAKKAGPLLHLFLPHIPVYFLQLMKPEPMHLLFHCFAILPPDGIMKNFMFPLYELNRISARKRRI